MSISRRDKEVLMAGKDVGACCWYFGVGAEAFWGEGIIWFWDVGLGEVGVLGRRLRAEKRPRKSCGVGVAAGDGVEVSSVRPSVSSISESDVGSSVYTSKAIHSRSN